MWISDEEVSQYEKSQDELIFFRSFTLKSENEEARKFAENSKRMDGVE